MYSTRRRLARTAVPATLAAAGLLLVAAATAPVLAHHAFGAEFDPNRPVLLRGPVVKVEWVNPHAWIHMEVTNEDGSKEVWMVEGGTPEHAAAARPAARLDPAGHDDHRRRLPEQGPHGARQRPRRDVRGRQQVLHGLVRHRRAARRARPDRAAPVVRAPSTIANIRASLRGRPGGGRASACPVSDARNHAAPPAPRSYGRRRTHEPAGSSSRTLRRAQPRPHPSGRRWLRQPQAFRLRRALFQIHLWSGIAVGLYVIAICVSGSVLVYRSELRQTFEPQPRFVTVAGARLSQDELTAAAERAYPGTRPCRASSSATTRPARSPSPSTAAARPSQMLFDPYTGQDLGNRLPLPYRLTTWLLGAARQPAVRRRRAAT